MTIAAIETVYKGYKFRSRLEARWAVAFDLHKIAYEYEPEAYLLPSGAYLPDFYFPKWDMFGEVKRGEFTNGERTKCKELVLATGKNCLLLDGLPTYGAYEVIECGGWFCECESVCPKNESEKCHPTILYSELCYLVFCKGKNGSCLPYYHYGRKEDCDGRDDPIQKAVSYRFWNPSN